MDQDAIEADSRLIMRDPKIVFFLLVSFETNLRRTP